MNEQLKNIWSVSKVIEEFKNIYPDDYLKYSSYINKIIKAKINNLRNSFISKNIDSLPFLADFINEINSEFKPSLETNFQHVINATGIIINTNFGRAPLSAKATKQIEKLAGGYSNLEYNIGEGIRGSRQNNVEKIINYLTGSESSFVINNNAATIFLICNTFANGKEVIASRGELIEIGDSFRLPEIIKHSNSILIEVGTTNKTYINDYIKAINPNTRILIKSHPSNFKIVGFTEEVSSAELAKTAKEFNLISFEDIGSGLLISQDILGLTNEPYIIDKVNSGIDLISFSGDKLLGASQAGIILGKKELIDKLKANPLSRAMRIDKLNLMVLETTLKSYLLEKEYLLEEIPVLKMIVKTYNQLKLASEEFCKNLKNIIPDLNIEIIDSFSQVGGGSFPEEALKTPVISIKPDRLSTNKFSEKLRKNKPAIIGKIIDDRFIINLRTIFPDEITILEKSIIKYL